MVHVAGRKENLKQYHGQGAGMVQATQGPMPRPSEFFVEMALEAAQNEHHRLYRWCSKFFSDIQKNILISIHEQKKSFVWDMIRAIQPIQYKIGAI